MTKTRVEKHRYRKTNPRPDTKTKELPQCCPDYDAGIGMGRLTPNLDPMATSAYQHDYDAVPNTWYYWLKSTPDDWYQLWPVGSREEAIRRTESWLQVCEDYKAGKRL